MNYRHAYHAGNFADVMKHAVLALVLRHLALKPAPFRVVDTHAGIGRYDLTSDAAQRTGEWRHGIGRLLGDGAEPLPADISRLMQPYLDAVRRENGGGALARYPGSPLLALAMMRADDRLVANELHPDDNATLRRVIDRDRRAKVLALDGWVALKSLLPPRERRGVVLIDPPFEERGELDRLVDGLAEARRRFATGSYLLWHPIKDPRPAAAMRRAVAAEAGERLIAAELYVRAPDDVTRLNGSGLVVVNPPHTLAADLAVLLPWLAGRLAQGEGAAGRLLDGPALGQAGGERVSG